MHSIVHFSHFVFKCGKQNYICFDYLLALLIINLSFVAMLKLTNRIPSYLAYSGFFIDHKPGLLYA